MIKRFLAISIVLVAAATSAYDQSRSKRVKQPREVQEAFRVCTEFRSLLAENFDFGRAFEATFVKDPAKRRAIAIGDSQVGDIDLSQADDATVTEIYKNETQLFILILPMLFLQPDEKDEISDPALEALIARVRQKAPHNYKEYAAELKHAVAELRTHLEKRAAKSAAVARGVRQYKEHLLKPLEPPNRIVKPITGYSKGRVLPVNAKYYQIDHCAVIREDGQMKLIGYTFFAIRW